MRQGDEAEQIAMETSIGYEIEDGWLREDVSVNNEAYDNQSRPSQTLSNSPTKQFYILAGGIFRLASLNKSPGLFVA